MHTDLPAPEKFDPKSIDMTAYFTKIASIFCLLCLVHLVTAQSIPDKQRRASSHPRDYQIKPITLDKLAFPLGTSTRSFAKRSYKTLHANMLNEDRLFDTKNRMPGSQHSSIWVAGTLRNPSKARDLNRKELHESFLHEAMHGQATDTWTLVATEKRAEIHHSKYQQHHHGLPIWGHELTLHQKGSQFSLTGLAPKKSMPRTTQPSLDKAQAISVVDADLQTKKVPTLSAESRQKVLDLMEEDVKELVLYPQGDALVLAWHISRHPNPTDRYEYFVDANSGEILNHYSSLCKLHHPPAKMLFNERSEGQGLDLHGQNRRLQTWQYEGAHFLLDATKSSMFDDSRSVMPSRPVGAIITLDAVNTFPGHDNFTVRDLVSFATTWDNPNAVSAHLNASVAFDYFEQKFGRISLNGQGGNIISLVNVVDEDGKQMDNAFWNGKAMFFGNGSVAFSAPLAKSLDATVHELTHGVVQTTANLDYMGESGALNESFADVFAVQVDRDDWFIGEDIVNTNIFRTGGLRSMTDPHNGGNKIGDPGYQPAHYDERFTGREDNGGVHFNSGIPNRAFYLFASAIGDDASEQVYYNVLTNYLTRSSQFTDLRIAVIDASQMMFGSEAADAARMAFDEVGIIGDQGGSYFEDEEENPGNDLVFIADDERSVITLLDGDKNVLLDPLEEGGLLNPPSVTDDGSFMVYVADDRTIHFGQFDWSVSPATYGRGVLEPNPIWHNVAISRDGLKLAAIPDALTDSVYIFSLDQETFQIYELYNPTTSSIDISTGDVLYADAIEWDHYGEYLLYDAFNTIKSVGETEAIEYWDIGFMRVWDEANSTYGDGSITKLFNGLREGIGVANPTFSENSPYIIAFDLIDDTEDELAYQVIGANIETGDLGLLYDNIKLGYPSYSRDDQTLLFDTDATDDVSTFEVVGQINIAEDKISGEGEATIFRDASNWGVWFSNGARELFTPTVDDELIAGGITLFPNPVTEVLSLNIEGVLQQQDAMMEIQGIDGRIYLTKPYNRGDGQTAIQVGSLPTGLYILHFKGAAGRSVHKFCKR